MPNALTQLLLLHSVKPICCGTQQKMTSFVLMHLILSCWYTNYITYTNSSFFVNTKSWFPVKHKYSNNFG